GVSTLRRWDAYELTGRLEACVPRKKATLQSSWPVLHAFSEKILDEIVILRHFCSGIIAKNFVHSASMEFLMVFFKRLTILLLVFAEITVVSGCVRRRLTVRTNPPGAVAYLDNVELGKTPISRNFDYYGNRELKLIKEGYEPHVETIRLRAPWYQWIGLDFFSEVLIPGTITDEHEYPITLKPQQIVSPDDLIAEGERMKAMAHSSGTYRVSSGSGRNQEVPQSDPYSSFEAQPTDREEEQLLPPPAYPPSTYLQPENLDSYSFTAAPIPENYSPAPEPRI
ncbi:MAG: PEGA domain-containing protein, partial [Planctomycetaceae bacterium]|nr:PEGA domain-containing protein [Planctomycetaceae bacterium]